VVDLWARLQAFLHTPTQKRWERLMAAWNRTANSVHNNGCFVNKWSAHVGGFCFCPARGFARNAVRLYELLKAWKKEEKEEADKEAQKKLDLGTLNPPPSAPPPPPSMLIEDFIITQDVEA
jgi:hypothetical protein